MPALLLSQLSGLAHRVYHSGWINVQAPSLRNNTDAVIGIFYNGESPQHSCTLFDASTLVECLHDGQAVLPDTSTRDALALFAANKTWLAQPQVYFSSRAPPFSDAF
ncbi:MAG: hypothetical protein Q7U12_16850 [Undibacterium sp.]|nr:hypothetical protein [Undibacterium sp.]